jgi:hypothetical protein
MDNPLERFAKDAVQWIGDFDGHNDRASGLRDDSGHREKPRVVR